jgi:hypothetical protein
MIDPKALIDVPVGDIRQTTNVCKIREHEAEVTSRLGKS